MANASLPVCRLARLPRRPERGTFPAPEVAPFSVPGFGWQSLPGSCRSPPAGSPLGRTAPQAAMTAAVPKRAPLASGSDGPFVPRPGRKLRPPTQTFRSRDFLRG